MLVSRKIKRNNKRIVNKAEAMATFIGESEAHHNELLKGCRYSVDAEPYSRSSDVNRPTQHFVQKIVNELVDDFGFDRPLAIRLIRRAQVVRSLTQNPIGFHDSPHQWAIKVLTKVNDYETLSKYYEH